jgi:hypothetical protein
MRCSRVDRDDRIHRRLDDVAHPRRHASDLDVRSETLARRAVEQQRRERACRHAREPAPTSISVRCPPESQLAIARIPPARHEHRERPDDDERRRRGRARAGKGGACRRSARERRDFGGQIHRGDYSGGRSGTRHDVDAARRIRGDRRRGRAPPAERLLRRQRRAEHDQVDVVDAGELEQRVGRVGGLDDVQRNARGRELQRLDPVLEPQLVLEMLAGRVSSRVDPRRAARS